MLNLHNLNDFSAKLTSAIQSNHDLGSSETDVCLPKPKSEV